MIDIESLKSEIVDRLQVLDPYKIIIFGSYATGNATQESDLDICVVEKDYVDKYEEKAKIDALLDFISLPKDILNPKLEEYEFYKNEFGSVYKDIEDKGLVLWSL